jgi:D-alanyl-D-alanine carboxypeptidase (penicillin-binding protein 5/6)
MTMRRRAGLGGPATCALALVAALAVALNRPPQVCAQAASSATSSAKAAPKAAAKPSGRPSLPFKPEAPYKAAILIDRDSGEVLFAENEHLPWPPASMVKMMTLLLAIEAVKAGQISLDDPVTASAWASKMGGSQVYLQEGETFPLRDMLAAIMISSANDASVAVAERIAGSTDAFVDRMNERAKELGLTETTFHTPHGLPPGEGQSPDLMSAADLAKLGSELAKYPEMMQWASTVEAPFRDGKFTMRNTNHLIRTYRGADGLKTGYYAAAGFEVTATASRDGLRLLAVVLGVPTKQGSFDQAARLLTKGFTDYRAIEPVKAGQAIGAEISVSGGTEKSFQGEAAQGFRTVLPRAEAQKVQVEVKVPAQVSAPVKKGQQVGEIVAMQGDRELARIPVVAPRDVEATSFWSRWLSGCQS